MMQMDIMERMDIMDNVAGGVIKRRQGAAFQVLTARKLALPHSKNCGCHVFCGFCESRVACRSRAKNAPAAFDNLPAYSRLRSPRAFANASRCGAAALLLGLFFLQPLRGIQRFHDLRGSWLPLCF